MKKKLISDFRLISENAPEKYVATVLSAHDVCKSTERFFSDNFRGAILLKMPENTCGYVITSPDGIAYFFKVLLNSVFGDSAIKIKMSCDRDFLTLSTVWNGEQTINEYDLKELERVARLSGFGFEVSSEGGISRVDVFLSLQTLSFIPIYATDTNIMHQAYVKVFFLI